MTLEARSARRERREGREALAFGGSDYLALAHEPALRHAFVAAAKRYGVSLAASRSTSGSCAEHEALERELAAFLGVDAALVVACGSLANDIACATLASERLGASVRTAPARSESARTCVHARAHASLADAARARLGPIEIFGEVFGEVFGEPAELPVDVRAVLVDGVDPMRGRVAPLGELARRLGTDGVLVVDEAHSLGVLGPRGKGAVAASGVGGERVLLTGSLSKACGAVGGYVAGARRRIDAARAEPAFVGSTALSPALAALARAALELCANGDARRERLFRHVERLRAAVVELGFAVGPDPFPVFALEFESTERTAEVARALLELGVAVPNVRYLGDGPRGALRLTLNAAHEDEDVERLLAALRATLEPAR